MPILIENSERQAGNMSASSKRAAFAYAGTCPLRCCGYHMPFRQPWGSTVPALPPFRAEVRQVLVRASPGYAGNVLSSFCLENRFSY